MGHARKSYDILFCSELNGLSNGGSKKFFWMCFELCKVSGKLLSRDEGRVTDCFKEWGGDKNLAKRDFLRFPVEH